MNRQTEQHLEDLERIIAETNCPLERAKAIDTVCLLARQLVTAIDLEPCDCHCLALDLNRCHCQLEPCGCDGTDDTCDRAYTGR
jgi:hypothetical protein